MVLQKRLDYGSSGHQVPAMPHVPRSARGKRSVRKKVEDNQMCAIDMLATLAGELLSDGENSSFQRDINGAMNLTTAKNTVKQELLDKEKPFKAEAFDQGSCDEGTLGADIQRQGDHTSKEFFQITKAVPPVSDFIKCDTSYKDGLVGESVISNTRDEYGYSLGLVPEKCGTERQSPGSAESCDGKGEGIKTPLRAVHRRAGNVMEENATDMFSLEDPMDLDAKPPALVSSDSSAEVPSCRNRISCSSTFPKCGVAMEMVVDRDDDENSSGCTHPSTITTKTFRPQHIEDCKIRKLLSPKYWKVAPTMLYDGEFSNADLEMNPVFRSKKMCYTRQRTQRSSFKRRKLFQRCSLSASDRRNCSEGISSAPVKCSIKVEAADSHANLQGANGASTSTSGQKTSYESGDYHVKLNIKSFKVPELFIEMPETATVGSLKRTVMEAVTAILGGGLRVGVLLQGKKVRDDNKTLRQTGISHVDKLDSLGFTLEPNPTQASPPLTSFGDEPFLCSGDGTEPLARIPLVDPTPDRGAPEASPQPLLTSAANCLESDHDSVHSPADASSLDRTAANSKALVPVPSVNVEALAVVPLRKSRRSEVAQRRIRRPFSVAEVEALVQAVEKLGTGRWRDVKLRAFDNAKHRTYVDLKDKWKTLVHTARISPQQRRGEPVPQELLDRVLAAHAYWSQQQARLQAKPPPAEACLLL